jgi:hypothetical protein
VVVLLGPKIRIRYSLLGNLALCFLLGAAFVFSREPRAIELLFHETPREQDHEDPALPQMSGVLENS